MKLRPSSLLPLLACGCVLFAFAAARWSSTGLFERLEWVTYDARVRAAAAHPSPCDTNLGFVFIDDTTIAAVRAGLLGAPYGLYWPRHVYGRILEQLQEEGVDCVAFDVLFADLRPDLGGLLRADGFACIGSGIRSSAPLRPILTTESTWREPRSNRTESFCPGAAGWIPSSFRSTRRAALIWRISTCRFLKA